MKIHIWEHKKKSSQINCLSLFYLRVISMLLGNLKLKLKKENTFINFRRFPSNHNKHPYSKLLHDRKKYLNLFHTCSISWSADLLSVLRLAEFTCSYMTCLKIKENRYRPSERIIITPTRPAHKYLFPTIPTPWAASIHAKSKPK